MAEMTATARQYWQLTKPRVVALIVFTAFVGMLLARVDPAPGMPPSPPQLPPLAAAVFGFIGIWLAAASAATINQLLDARIRSEEHTSELQSLMRISYAVFCLKKKKKKKHYINYKRQM